MLLIHNLLCVRNMYTIDNLILLGNSMHLALPVPCSALNGSFSLPCSNTTGLEVFQGISI